MLFLCFNGVITSFPSSLRHTNKKIQFERARTVLDYNVPTRLDHNNNFYFICRWCTKLIMLTRYIVLSIFFFRCVLKYCIYIMISWTANEIIKPPLQSSGHIISWYLSTVSSVLNAFCLVLRLSEDIREIVWPNCIHEDTVSPVHLRWHLSKEQNDNKFDMTDNDSRRLGQSNSAHFQYRIIHHADMSK